MSYFRPSPSTSAPGSAGRRAVVFWFALGWISFLSAMGFAYLAVTSEDQLKMDVEPAPPKSTLRVEDTITDDEAAGFEVGHTIPSADGKVPSIPPGREVEAASPSVTGAGHSTPVLRSSKSARSITDTAASSGDTTQSSLKEIRPLDPLPVSTLSTQGLGNPSPQAASTNSLLPPSGSGKEVITFETILPESRDFKAVANGQVEALSPTFGTPDRKLIAGGVADSGKGVVAPAIGSMETGGKEVLSIEEIKSGLLDALGEPKPRKFVPLFAPGGGSSAAVTASPSRIPSGSPVSDLSTIDGVRRTVGGVTESRNGIAAPSINTMETGVEDIRSIEEIKSGLLDSAGGPEPRKFVPISALGSGAAAAVIASPSLVPSISSAATTPSQGPPTPPTPSGSKIASPLPAASASVPASSPTGPMHNSTPVSTTDSVPGSTSTLTPIPGTVANSPTQTALPAGIPPVAPAVTPSSVPPAASSGAPAVVPSGVPPIAPSGDPPVASSSGPAVTPSGVPPVASSGIPPFVPAAASAGVLPATIPPATPPTTPGDPRYADLLCIPWTVQPGQTVESLAASLSVDPETIRGINGISTLVPGQRIRIPVNAPTLCCE